METKRFHHLSACCMRILDPVVYRFLEGEANNTRGRAANSPFVIAVRTRARARDVITRLEAREL